MITTQQKEQIISILGKHYSPEIINYLEYKNIKPLRADSFSSIIIQNIMNGATENLLVENAILDLTEKVKKTILRLENKKLKLNL